MTKRPLLRQREAALYCGVSVSYLRASRCPKVLLPGHGPKGRPVVRYDPDALDRWLGEHTVREQAG